VTAADQDIRGLLTATQEFGGMLGLHRPSSGSITLYGKAISDLCPTGNLLRSVLQHESFHYWQLIGTSFGISQWARLHSRSVTVFQFLRSIAHANLETPIFPIQRWGNESKSEVVCGAIERMFTHLRASALRELSFIGSPSRESEQVKPEETASAMELAKPLSSTVHVGIDVGNPPQRVDIGSIAVKEGAALAMQIRGLHLLPGKSEELIDILRGVLGQFLANSSVLSSCVELCGVAGLQRETQ